MCLNDKKIGLFSLLVYFFLKIFVVPNLIQSPESGGIGVVQPVSPHSS